MNKNIKRRRLGKTGFMVTELSFGAMNLRLLDNLDQAYQILNYVLDNGINFIDTARAYNGTMKDGTPVESEILVGNVIRQRTDLKEPLLIVTKGHGYTPDVLEQEFFTSRNKLGINGQHDLKIGNNEIKLVYFFHGINRQRWVTMKSSGVLDIIQQYKKDGYTTYIGFSAHYGDTDVIAEAIKTDIFDVVELPYNILNRSLGEPYNDSILKLAYDHDVGIINMKAFGGNAMPAIFSMLKDYITLDHNKMLRFCLANPYISAVDAGARYIKEFESDIEAALQGPLSAEEIERYSKEADSIAAYLSDYCRDCRHCQEKFTCPTGIEFPDILVLYSRFLVSQKLGRDLSEFYEKYRSFSLNGADCIECNQCAPWCEYKLNISGLLKKAHEALAR